MAFAWLRGMPALSALAGASSSAGRPTVHHSSAGRPTIPQCYRRRTPETEPLYQVMAGHLETFLERTRSFERQLPTYVERELRAYLECGILPFGFLRVRCQDCGQSRVVAFSCKKRGFCPSCTGRRMSDTAARLTDEVLPEVPVRQWVLSLPYEIRFRLASDGDLLSAVLAVFLRVVYGWYRRRAREEGRKDARCGSVTFVQRFGSALNLNPHFHVLMPDGVFVDGPGGTPVFVPASTPIDDDIRRIAETTAHRIVKLLERRGLLEPDAPPDALVQEEPLLAALTAASIRGTVATGERAGQRVRRRLVDPEEGIRSGPLCFSSRGFSLHAATCVEAGERERLERLCRYVIRPPLAAGRLQMLDEDTLSFTLKTPWSDGTTHLVLSPLELIEKLAALVPRPRLNLIRYHGVLAPNAAGREYIVPGPYLEEAGSDAPCAYAAPTHSPQPAYRLSWARLLARVFRVDVTVCPDCGGTMKIIAALTDPHAIRTYLDGVGLTSRPPPIAPQRPRPQTSFEFEYA